MVYYADVRLLKCSMDWLHKGNCSRLYRNVEHVGFLELSHCKITDSLFSQIPVQCPMLKFLLIQDCQEITDQAYIVTGLKKHRNLKILNVAYNRNALSLRCVIRGQTLAQVEFSKIIREHLDALERAFQDVDDYVCMLLS